MKQLFCRKTSIAICIGILSLANYAQTGPGGVGNSASNVIWLSADKNVYNDAGVTLASDGDRVPQWNDRSGNAKNVSEGSGGQQPLYKTNIINSTLPVIRFDGSNDRISVTGVSTAGSVSLWVVAKYTSLPSANPGLVQGSPAGKMFSSTAGEKSVGLWVENTGSVWGRGVQSDGTQKNISKVTSLSAGTFYIINSMYNGTAAINQYVNNAASGTVAYNGTLLSWSDFGIGRQAAETWDGDIAEVIAFNTALNNAQRIIIDNYLSSKYNIPLSSNDIYTMDSPGNGNFDSEMAGIGQASDGSNFTDAQGSGMVRINNPRGLGNNEFLMWGNDNAAIGQAFSDLPAGVQVRMGRTWRASEQGEVGNIDISFDLSGLGSITVSDLRLIIDTDNDGIFSDETPLSGAVSMGANVYKFSNFDIDNGQKFTIGSINKSTTPLPIELISFTAVKDGDAVKLKWITATEINNDYFEVERSQNGATFEVIGKVKGSGNSSTKKEYSLIDDRPIEGNSYYRLKQTDFDGKNETFNMIAIYYEKKPGGECVFKVYPNPCLGQCSVALEDCDNAENPDIAVEVIDASGNKVYSKVPMSDEKGLFNFQLDTENNLKPGIYIVRGANKKSSYTQKLIVK